MPMAPQKQKAKRIRSETEKAEDAHDLESGDGWREQLGHDLRGHGTSRKENKPALNKATLALAAPPLETA